MTKLVALIGAAGNSIRMGQHKALLPIENTTFIQKIFRTFKSAGVEEIWATHPDQSGLNANTLAKIDIPALKNRWPHRSLLGSVQSILNIIPKNTTALLICPVDAPFACSQTIRKMIKALSKEKKPLGAKIIVATHGGAYGHPIIFSDHFFESISKLGDHDSLRTIVAAHQKSIIRIECKDPKVLCNINTKEDYALLVKPSLKISEAAATEAPGLKFS